MKQCPECGYVDPPCWLLQGRGGRDVEYCRIDELERDEPELAKELRENKETQDEIYAYILSDKGYVRRRWLPIFKVQAWAMIPVEHVDHGGPSSHRKKIKTRPVKHEPGPFMRSLILSSKHELAKLVVSERT